MIDEIATIKLFGYSSSELNKGSHKPVVAICPVCGKVKIKERRNASRVCIGCGKKGEETHNWKGGKVKRICVTCGKVFFTAPSRLKYGRGNFCSRSCAAKEGARKRRIKRENDPDFHINKKKKKPYRKKGNIKRECEICGKVFYAFPRQIAKGQGKYCSRKCVYISRLKNNEGKIKRECPICGKVFYVFPSKIKKGAGKYCSRKCAGIAHSKNKDGSIVSDWDGGKTERKCKWCGKIFEIYPSRILDNRGKYCSRSCASKAARYNARPQKTEPEIIFENICTKYKLPFRFVGDGTLWLGNANPDFIHKTRKVVCEVFGEYWHSPLINKNTIKNIKTVDGRKAQLKKEGYKLIVFWETDLKREDAEAFVLLTLKKNKIKF